MADYYPLLSRAVGALSDRSPEMRRAVYDRAQTALLDQLRSLDPPLSEADIDRERRSLEATIRRIEAEHQRENGVGHGEPPLPEARMPSPQAPEVMPERRPAPPAPTRRAGQGGARPRLGGDREPGQDEAEEPARDRPRIETVAPSLERGGRARTAILAAVIGLVMAAIAVTAWFLRDKPGEVAAGPASPEATQPAEAEAKIGGRIGGGERAPSASPNAAPQGQPAQGQRGEVAIAQRAVLYEENPADPQNPKATQGRAVWRVESLNPGRGQPLETVVRTQVEVPAAGLSLTLTIRRNTDPALPNSHTIEMTFTTPPGDGNRVVREVGPPQFKTEEGVRGTQLAGLAMPARDNLFLMLLSNLDADVKRNTELLASRNWIDLPIRFASGQRAILSFEKGVPGDLVITEALRQWKP